MSKKEAIIVADASPIIAFARIHALALLSEVLGKIILPERVANECLNGETRLGAKEIKLAIDHRLLSVHPNIPLSKEIEPLTSVLDEGEAAAISLALQIKSGVLMDEKLGRNVAAKLEIPVIGTAGILLLAKQKKKIDLVKPVIDQLKQAGCFLSKDLLKEVIKRAKE